MQKSLPPLMAALLLGLPSVSSQTIAQPAPSATKPVAPVTAEDWIQEGFRHYELKDNLRAVQAFEKAAEKGSVLGQSLAGALYVTGGNGLNTDYPKAVSWLRKAADGGSHQAQSLLATLYTEGNGVPKDVTKARELYTQAAASGNKIAIQWLESNPAPRSNKTPDQLYNEGQTLHTAKKFAEALPLMTEAAERGHGAAQSRLAGMYLSGEGVTTNYEKSFYWTKKAAEQGRALDEYALGVMYWNGIGIAKDQTTARQWIQKSADRGFPAAIDWRSKNDGYVKTAAEWFNEGANFHLAGDYAKAVPALTKASDMGDALSASMIGGMYLEGTYFPQDYAKAFQWYKLAADRGNRESQFLVGLLYYNGRGVPQDMVQGKQWIRKSSAQGLTQATDWLAKNGG
ncbi:MAG: hypothetical protein QM645_05010 [Asticcacaulis sp.]